MWQSAFYIVSVIALICVGVLTVYWHAAVFFLILIVPLIALGIYDIYSQNNGINNYPVFGHIHYMMESVSPEIRQYFLEDDKSGRTFNRQQRHLVAMRAAGKSGTHPFGTEYDIQTNGYHFALHSIDVKSVPADTARVCVGGPGCAQPYHSSRLNISARSFGALSSRAVLAMNKGARLGGFAQDTGEGGLTPYHLEYGADVIWEIGSGFWLSH